MSKPSYSQLNERIKELENQLSCQNNTDKTDYFKLAYQRNRLRPRRRKD